MVFDVWTITKNLVVIDRDNLEHIPLPTGKKATDFLQKAKGFLFGNHSHPHSMTSNVTFRSYKFQCTQRLFQVYGFIPYLSTPVNSTLLNMPYANDCSGQRIQNRLRIQRLEFTKCFLKIKKKQKNSTIIFKHSLKWFRYVMRILLFRGQVGCTDPKTLCWILHETCFLQLSLF